MLKSLHKKFTFNRELLRTENRSDEFIRLDIYEIAYLIGLIENAINGEKAANKKDTVLDGTEHKSDFHPTVEYMLSADYKKRFVAEYLQTKIRYEKLKDFCNKIEASDLTGAEAPKHDCPICLLRQQQRAMGEYLHILEIRAIIEKIDLKRVPL